MIKIPGILSGIFFLSLCAAWADPLALATRLYEEGQWTECRRECRRHLIVHPEDDAARLLLATAALRERVEVDQAISELENLLARASDPELRAMAGFEAGLEFRTRGELPRAWAAIKVAFAETRSPWLFARSSCALAYLYQADKDLATGEEALLRQLRTAQPLWTKAVRDEMRPTRKPRRSYNPGSLVVAFYRSQIGPAIGDRCSLHPSCSEYYLLAEHDHGWMAVPLVADRLVREPGVVAAAEKPLYTGDRILYQNPVEDHTFWLNDEH